jgi:hypothetical protein
MRTGALLAGGPKLHKSVETLHALTLATEAWKLAEQSSHTVVLLRERCLIGLHLSSLGTGPALRRFGHSLDDVGRTAQGETGVLEKEPEP